MGIDNPFDPIDFGYGYPPLFPDPLEEQTRAMRDFNQMNSMTDMYEKFIEQPPLTGDWRFSDRVGRDLTNVELHTELGPMAFGEPLNRPNLQGKRLPNILTKLENQIEATVIPGPTASPEIPSVDPLKPGGYVGPDNPLVEEESSGFYRGLSDRVRYQIRGSRSGTRKSEEGDWCFDRQERITREDCEVGCSHWDSDSMKCKYFEDWERDHPPEED